MIRPVEVADWPDVLELANAAVRHVPGAGSQQTWMDNRRRAEVARHVLGHFVAERPGGHGLLGFCGVEVGAQGEYRLFVVTAPEDLASIGEVLYERAEAILRERGARRVWFTEYAADESLIAFASQRGFKEQRRFLLDEATEAISLAKELDGGHAA